MKHLKNISKQNKRKILISFITVLVCLFNRPFKVSASSGTYYLLDIGSYGQLGQFQEDSTGTGRSFKYTVTISLKAKYNGTITITTNNNISNQDKIATYNCEMDNATTTSYTLRIYNSSFCSFVYECDTAKVFTPSSQSLTKVADIDYYPELGSINTKLTNIYNSIDGVEGYIDNVETYLNTLNTTTNTISTNVSDIETTLNTISTNSTSIDDTLDDISADVGYINTDVGHIRSLITTQNVGISTITNNTNTIKNDLASILNTLTASATDISNGVADLSSINTTLSGMSQNLANLYSRVNEINQNVADIEYFLNNSILPALNGITSAVNSVTSAINNIDTLIDEISWINQTNVNIYWSNELTGDQTKWFNTNLGTGQYSKIYIYFNGFPNSNENIIKLDLVLYNNTNYSDIAVNYVGMINGSTLVKYNSTYTYSSYFKYHSYIYLYGNNLATYNNYHIIEVDARNRYVLFEIINQNNKFQYISSNDIEYWQLLNNFQNLNYYEYEKQHNATIESKLNDIITAINGININNNISNTEITNTTNNFDNDIETIHNVENNYKLDYDAWNNSVNPSDITIDLTSYNDTVNLYKSNITSMWSSDLVSVPVTLSILVFIFLVILG